MAVLARRDRTPPREVGIGAHAAARRSDVLVDEMARAAIDRAAREGPRERRAGGDGGGDDRVAGRERQVHVRRIPREELREARLEEEPLARGGLGGGPPGGRARRGAG